MAITVKDPTVWLCHILSVDFETGTANVKLTDPSFQASAKQYLLAEVIENNLVPNVEGLIEENRLLKERLAACEKPEMVEIVAYHFRKRDFLGRLVWDVGFSAPRNALEVFELCRLPLHPLPKRP